MRPLVATDARSLAEIEASVDRELPPRLDRLLQALHAAAPLPAQSLRQMRETFEVLTARMSLPEGLDVRESNLDGTAVEIVTPDQAVARTVVYLHGGALTLGSARTGRPLAGRLAEATRSTVVSVDYRLAPEYPFPAAIDDVDAVLGWIGRHEPDRAVILAGDSAGGGLALAVALRQQVARRANVRAVVAMSPWTNLDTSWVSSEALTRDPQVPGWLLARSAAAYCGANRPTDAGISAIHGALDGLPPTLVQVGSGELLFDDALRFARASFAAGAPLRFECWPGMPHVWQAFAPRLPEGTRALGAIREWLDDVLAR